MGLIHGRHLWKRSVIVHWRSINHGNTDHKKHLQIYTFWAMRAVFDGSCARGVGFVAGLVTDDQGALKATSNVLLDEGRVLHDPEGPNR